MNDLGEERNDTFVCRFCGDSTHWNGGSCETENVCESCGSLIADAAIADGYTVAEGQAWKPCIGCDGKGSEMDSCPDDKPGCCVAHFRQHRKCNGTGRVVAGGGGT